MRTRDFVFTLILALTFIVFLVYYSGVDYATFLIMSIISLIAGIILAIIIVKFMSKWINRF